MPPADFEVVYPRSRGEWRRWLELHHAASPGIWLVLEKRSAGPACLALEAAVEEALCFGWIDSKANKLDEQRFKLMVTPRKPGSVWSKINKGRIERLAAAGLLAPTGIAKIEAARRDGSWGFLDSIDNLVVPSDLADALAGSPQAERNFHAFSVSARRMILYWIAQARRPETRSRRIAETVEKAARNEKSRP